MLGMVTLGEHVNALERYCKGDISYTFKKKINGSLSKIKGLILPNDVCLYARRYVCTCIYYVRVSMCVSIFVST